MPSENSIAADNINVCHFFMADFAGQSYNLTVCWINLAFFALPFCCIVLGGFRYES